MEEEVEREVVTVVGGGAGVVVVVGSVGRVANLQPHVNRCRHIATWYTDFCCYHGPMTQTPEPRPAFSAPSGAISWEEMQRMNAETRARNAHKSILEQARETLGPDATETDAEFLYEMGLL